MKRTSFNDDWRVRPKVSHFQELLGGGAQPWEAVRLPHDAMIGGPRDPDEHWGNGFFPGGVWQYEKTFVADEELRGKRVLLEFEGVYRGASVWVNGALAGHRPYGYTDFTVSIGEHEARPHTAAELVVVGFQPEEVRAGLGAIVAGLGGEDCNDMDHAGSPGGGWGQAYTLYLVPQHFRLA